VRRGRDVPGSLCPCSPKAGPGKAPRCASGSAELGEPHAAPRRGGTGDGTALGWHSRPGCAGRPGPVARAGCASRQRVRAAEVKGAEQGIENED